MNHVFKCMNFGKLKSVLGSEPKYRLKQVNEFVFKNFISDWEEAKSLPKNLREKLKMGCPLDVNAEIFESKDGKTSRALITFDDGSRVEAVLMRHSDIHNTVCVSCQVGCAMGCDFCATGKLGLKRDLTADEIIAQVLVFARSLKRGNQRISNVVFMGMGEPFLNYENVISAVYKLNAKDSFDIAARKISISTCGIVSGIEKLLNEPLQVNLAISLHAPNDVLRTSLMPVNKSFNISETLSAVKRYIDKTGRKVMIEYILLKGVNDSSDHAKALADLLLRSVRGLFMVNLIVYNSTIGKYRTPFINEVKAFREVLEGKGVTVTQRFRFGHDIEGACGQLAGKV